MSVQNLGNGSGRTTLSIVGIPKEYDMHFRFMTLAFALTLGAAAHAQTNSLFISGNVITGNLWNPATNAGGGTSGSCSVGSSQVNYYSLPFFTDTTGSNYTMGIVYDSFQSGFIYIYQDAFDPQDPCNHLKTFAFAPVANVQNIQLDANRQYVFVTSEDVLFGGGGSFHGSIDGPAGTHLFQGSPPNPHVTYCFGDSTGTACPCGNAGGAGNGCASSVAPAGAHLAGAGAASIASDTLVLHGSGMPNSSALYFQGTARTAGGAGAVFGDGLRCASGTVIRLGTKVNTGGGSSYPAGGDAPVSVKGADVAGDVRDYQCWYRNAAAFCTVATFNLTNGLEVTWTP
jgi:hypothetical protein